MEITTSEKIKILVSRRKMTLGALAEKTGQSRQNLSNKLVRNNFSENELKKIAKALDCEYRSTFYMPDTQEEL